MRLSIRAFGLELLTIEASTEDEAAEGEELAGGATVSAPVGFCVSPTDQRWEKGVEFE